MRRAPGHAAGSDARLVPFRSGTPLHNPTTHLLPIKSDVYLKAFGCILLESKVITLQSSFPTSAASWPLNKYFISLKLRSCLFLLVLQAFFFN